MIRDKIKHAFTAKTGRLALSQVDDALLRLSDVMLQSGAQGAARKLRDVTARKN